MSYQEQETPVPLSASCRAIATAIDGERGRFAYQGFDWINSTLFKGQLPTPMILWGLTPHSHSLAFTHVGGDLPLIVLHPSLLGGTEKVSPWGMNPDWLGPHFALDALIHESLHLSIHHRYHGWSGQTSHNSQEWIAEVNRAAPLLGFGSFQAGENKLKRIPIEGEYGPSGKPKTKVKRISLATLAGESVPYDLVTSFPHSLRIHLGQADDYYAAAPTTLPFSSSLRMVVSRDRAWWE